MKKRAFLCCMAAGLLWGTSGVFSTLLAPCGFAPMQITAARGVGAALTMGLYVLLADRRRFRIAWRQLPLFVLGGVLIFATAAFFYLSVRAAGMSVAAVLMYTAPAFVMGYSVLFLGERFTGRKALALGMILVGCVLVSGVLSVKDAPSLFGVGTGLGSGLAYASYNIVARQESVRGDSPLSANLYHFLIMGGICLFLLDPPSFLALTGARPWATLPLLCLIGPVSCMFPYLLFSRSLRHVPVGTASAATVVEPMAAAFYSALFFGESLTPLTLIGIALILGACLLFGTAKEK